MLRLGRPEVNRFYCAKYYSQDRFKVTQTKLVPEEIFMVGNVVLADLNHVCYLFC